MVIKDFNLQDAKPSTVPGSKEEMKKAPTKDDDRGRAIDNIQEAKDSMHDTEWESYRSDELRQDDDGDDENIRYHWCAPPRRAREPKPRT